MKRRFGILIVTGAVLTATGCWFGTGSTSDIRYEVTRQTGVELEPEFGVKLGRITTAMAKPFARRHAAEIPLKGIAKVEVGVYNVVDDAEPVGGARLDDVRLDGWEPIARIRDSDETVQVLCQIDGERIRAMLVLVLDDDEMVVVRLKGNLQKFLPAALEHSGWSGIHGAVEGDLG